MKRISGVAIVALGFSCLASAQVNLPELPAPAGSEPSMPVLPAPSTSTFEPAPQPAPAAPAPVKRQLTEEEIARIKQDENWLVEEMKQKQREEEAAKLKRASELDSKKKPEPKAESFTPGEMANFKPVVSDSSLVSLNPAFKGDVQKKKNPTDNVVLPNAPTSSNPLASGNNGTVQPILGPSRMPQTPNTNLNPGLGVTPLPGTGIKKISSSTNFIPEGYSDSWTQQQKPLGPGPLSPQPANVPNPAPAIVRPSFKDLANTIPDPTQIR